MKGGTLSAGNILANPPDFDREKGKEKAERSPAMEIPKRIPVRKWKAAEPVRRQSGKETVKKLLATVAERQ